MIVPYRKEGSTTLDAMLEDGGSGIVFNIYTYAKYSKFESEWALLMPANELLNSLTKPQYDQFVSSMREVHELITEKMTPLNIEVIVKAIDSIIFDMAERLNLVSLIDKFVRSANIHTPDLSKAGTRPQDTDATTYYYEDYIEVYELIVLCKLLFIVFGEMIHQLKSIADFNNDIKEKYCLGTFKTLRETYFSKICTKLIVYIEGPVKRRNGSLISFSGYTSNALVTEIFAMLLIKKFVNTDLYKPDGNIMSFVYSCIERSLDSKFKKFKESQPFFIRFDDGDGGIDDEDKQSVLESMGTVLKRTIDIPILVGVGIRKYIDKEIKDRSLDIKMLDESATFYKKNELPVTPISEYISGMLNGDLIGSAFSIRFINLELMSELTVLNQLTLIEMGFPDLVPLLSIKPSPIRKDTVDRVTNSIMIRRGAGIFYQNCCTSLSHLGDLFPWEEFFKTMIDYLVKMNHEYIVAPKIKEKLDDPNTIGEIYTYHENIIERLYHFTALCIMEEE